MGMGEDSWVSNAMPYVVPLPSFLRVGQFYVFNVLLSFFKHNL